MAGIGARQPTDDRQPLLVARQRAGEIALRYQDVAGLVEADRDVALALGIGSGRPASRRLIASPSS